MTYDNNNNEEEGKSDEETRVSNVNSNYNRDPTVDTYIRTTPCQITGLLVAVVVVAAAIAFVVRMDFNQIVSRNNNNNNNTTWELKRILYACVEFRRIIRIIINRRKVLKNTEIFKAARVNESDSRNGLIQIYIYHPRDLVHNTIYIHTRKKFSTSHLERAIFSSS